MKMKWASGFSIAALGMATFAIGQAAPPPAPQPAVKTQPKLQLQAPGQPPAPAPPVKFPPVDPGAFTATAPTVSTVNAFLKQIWGYDANRKWQVQAIQKTDAPGVSRVVVLVAEEGVSRQPGQTTFFALPDGMHAIAGNEVMPFGSDPYGANRSKLSAGANGPYRGATAKTLNLVEFADLQCPHCKEAEATMDRLVQDYPNAHVVFENFPLTQIHPYAEKAAEYGVCVAQLKGNAAFFQYVQAVFDNQVKLNAETGDQTLSDAAAKAGVDAAAEKKCMEDPATKAAVAASIKLGYDVGVNETPMLFVNGRPLPVNALPYNVLKQIVDFAATQK